MKTSYIPKSVSLLSWGCTLALAVLNTELSLAEPSSNDQIIVGDTAEIAGGVAATWARVNGGGKVIWVGATIPLSIVENMPPPGSGPAGAIAVLNFPDAVQTSTYFNHLEIQSDPHGHPNPGGVDPNRYAVAHFDFHFYSIPPSDVLGIPGGPFFAEAAPELLPAGYAQPAHVSIPQLGRHAPSLAEQSATGEFVLTLIAGFLPDASLMHFLEPMISQEFLLRRENFTLPVPMPAMLGWATQYPTEFVAQYDRDADAYHFVFKGFEPIQ